MLLPKKQTSQEFVRMWGLAGLCRAILLHSWSTFAQTWASFSKSNVCITGEHPEKGDQISQSDNWGEGSEEMELFSLKRRKMGRNMVGLCREGVVCVQCHGEWYRK